MGDRHDLVKAASQGLGYVIIVLDHRGRCSRRGRDANTANSLAARIGHLAQAEIEALRLRFRGCMLCHGRKDSCRLSRSR